MTQEDASAPGDPASMESGAPETPNDTPITEVPSPPRRRRPSRRRTTKETNPVQAEITDTVETAANESAADAPAATPETDGSSPQAPQATRRRRPTRPKPLKPRSETAITADEAVHTVEPDTSSAGGPELASSEAREAPVEKPDTSPKSGKPSGPSQRKSKRNGASGAKPSPEEAAADVEIPGAVPEDAEQRANTRRSPKAIRTAKQAAHEAGPVRARIAVRKGLPEIVIGEETVPPAVFFGNVTAADSVPRVQSQINRAARAGVRIFSTLVELTCPLAPLDTVYDVLDQRIETLLSAQPGAFVLPRIVFAPAEGWKAQYPMDMQVCEDGPGNVSIGSDAFWAEAQRALRLLIEHVQRTSYGSRVIGYHLENGEWFQPRDGGADRSHANREAFRRWLRRKYNDNDVLFRAAWYDGDAQFYTVAVPTLPDPAVAPAFYDPYRERRWIDYMEYVSDQTVDRLLELAGAVKDATQGRALVSVCYGYVLEFGHPWSGHLGLGRLLESPTIDVLSGPISYGDRAPSRSGALPAPVGSIGIHGKLWMTEEDTKTHLARSGSGLDRDNPPMENRIATEAVQLRTAAMALCRQTGIVWMDLWGEGWLDSDETWSAASRHVTMMSKQLRDRRRTTPDVVAMIDEYSLCHFAGGDVMMARVLHDNRDSLLRSGASVDFYLQSDVTHKDFPTDAKLYIFLNPYRLPESHRDAIRDRLLQPGRTLVWLFAAGAFTDASSLDEPTPEIVGLNLRPQPWNSELGTRITQPGHVITQSLGDRTLGRRTRINPSFFIDDDDPEITVLGEYEQTGLPSLAYRTVGGHTTVFCGEPVLAPELVRGLCRFAGVHLYTRSAEDYAQAGAGWLWLHVLKDGQRTISLPSGAIAWDAAEAVCTPTGAHDFRTPVKAKTTRLFHIATEAAVRKLGIDTTRVRTTPIATVSTPAPVVAPPAAPIPLVAPPPPLPTFADRPSSALTVAEPREIAARPPEASTALMPLEGTEEVTGGGEDDTSILSEESAEVVAHTADSAAATAPKRRRRRGGRGRGRRRPEGDSASTSAPETPGDA